MAHFEKSITPPITGQCSTELRLRMDEGGFRKSTIWVERQNFYGQTKSDQNKAYIIVGFDTEYKVPDNPASLEDIETGKAKYVVVSYQVHCSVYDPAQPEAIEWSAICYPETDDRIKLTDLMLMAFAKGISSKSVETIPTLVYVVGHFTRADVPAFADFKDLTTQLSAVRSTFTSVDKGMNVFIEFDEGKPVEFLVILRDTMLLTAEGVKKLADIGELVGVPKVVLDSDPEKAKFYIANMDVFLAEHPDRFERYALTDALICVRYLQKVIDLYLGLFGKRKAPATLSSIGVDLLTDKWEKVLKFKSLYVVGKERLSAKEFSKRKGTSFPDPSQYLWSLYHYFCSSQRSAITVDGESSFGSVPHLKTTGLIMIWPVHIRQRWL
jgi:hypothetical protein